MKFQHLADNISFQVIDKDKDKLKKLTDLKREARENFYYPKGARNGIQMLKIFQDLKECILLLKIKRLVSLII